MNEVGSKLHPFDGKLLAAPRCRDLLLQEITRLMLARKACTLAYEMDDASRRGDREVLHFTIEWMMREHIALTADNYCRVIFGKSFQELQQDGEAEYIVEVLNLVESNVLVDAPTNRVQ